jgi:hypothetical protein
MQAQVTGSPSHSAFSFATAIGLIAAIPATIFYNKLITAR